MAEGVYRIRTYELHKDRFTMHGRRMEYDYVVDRDVAVVLPVFDNGKILMEHNYRRTLGKWIYELPGGHREPGETMAHAAARELEEETGFKPGRLSLLFDSFEAPGSGRHRTCLYLAKGIKKGKADLDPDEQIGLRTMTLGEAVKFVKKAKNTDVKTIAGILLYASMRSGPGRR